MSAVREPDVTAVGPTPFVVLGDPAAAVCEGDACELPDQAP